MKIQVAFVIFMFGCCYAGRNPFIFVAPQQAAHTAIVGRGMIHDKHMVCEAYTASDGSLQMRWIPHNVVVKKSPST